MALLAAHNQLEITSSMLPRQISTTAAVLAVVLLRISGIIRNSAIGNLEEHWDSVLHIVFYCVSFFGTNV